MFDLQRIAYEHPGEGKSLSPVELSYYYRHRADY
jgi:hypothetical protein